MNLDRKYYSFCKEVGLMKENFSREGALNAIKEAVAGERTADPEFIELVRDLTLKSPEVHFRACILYQYNAIIEYVRNGVINDTNISDIGTIGIADYLHITEYKGKGEYTVVDDISTVPYSYWNTENLLTFEDMKQTLSNTIGDKLPSGTQSFRSKDWDVSAYLVPVLSIEIKFGDKWYYLSYNLQNGYYHWEWPDHPELLDKGKKTKLYNRLLRIGAIVLSAIGFINALSNFNDNILALAVPVVIAILNIIVWKNSKKNGKFYDRFYIKNPDKSMFSQLIPGIIALITGFVAMYFGGM